MLRFWSSHPTAVVVDLNPDRSDPAAFLLHVTIRMAMNMRGFERPPTLNLLRVFAVATLIANHAVVVLTEPQTDAARRYSQDGLEMDLPGDWQLVTEGYEPWGRTFRSAATGGEVDFIVMLPINASSYLGSLERFLKEHLPNVEGRRDVKRLRVSGLEALDTQSGASGRIAVSG